MLEVLIDKLGWVPALRAVRVGATDDRPYRLDVTLMDGRVLRGCAPECVRGGPVEDGGAP